MSVKGRIKAAAFANIADSAREPDLSISTTAAQTAVLGGTQTSGEMYDLLSDITCYIKIATDASGVTATNGYPLLVNNMVTVFVPTGYRIGAITASGTGTIKIHRSS